MNHIANVGPLSVAVDASKWGGYSSGVFDSCTIDDNIQINHGNNQIWHVWPQFVPILT